MSAGHFSRLRTRNAGKGLIAVLLLTLFLGAAGLLGRDQLAARAAAAQQARSIAALAMAREALLGYSISYAETHSAFDPESGADSSQDYGYLPCPDRENTGSTSPGACGARDLAAFGRFPWRTVALPDLLDGANECLWYGVAGSIKNNPKALHLNWDSPGHFELLAANGATLPVAAADGLAVAVLIAPGPALAHQTRSAGDGPCRGATIAASDLAAFVDSTPGSLAHTIQLRQGLSGSMEGNDLLAWIGVDDVFDALRRRSDFAAYIDAIGERAAAALASLLEDTDFVAAHSTPVSGVLRTGALPSAAALGIHTLPRAHDNWRPQFALALCSAGDACIQVDHHADGGSSVSQFCRAALLFGGERIRDGAARQLRIGSSAHAQPTQFFEGGNDLHLQLGTPRFAGADRFRVANPAYPASADVVRCLS